APFRPKLSRASETAQASSFSSLPISSARVATIPPVMGLSSRPAMIPEEDRGRKTSPSTELFGFVAEYLLTIFDRGRLFCTIRAIASEGATRLSRSGGG